MAIALAPTQATDPIGLFIANPWIAHPFATSFDSDPKRTRDGCDTHNSVQRPARGGAMLPNLQELSTLRRQPSQGQADHR